MLFSTPDTYPAGAPFHIQHGWLTAPKDAPPGNFDFQLEMDGVYQSHDFYSVVGGQDALSITWLFNYPDGMSGVRTFTGHWFAPCQYAVELGMYPGPCPSPNMPVEAYTRTLTVTFTP